MVKVYFTPTCLHCPAVKAYLKSKNIPFEPIDLTKLDPIVQTKLISKLGRLSVPITEIEGHRPLYSLVELKEFYE